MCSFLVAVHWVIFELGIRFMFMSNGWVLHCLWVTIIPSSSFSADWLLFQSSMAFGVCFVESMLLSHIIWHPNKIENHFLQSLLIIQSFVPLPICQSYFDHYIIYPCFMSIDEGYINAFLQWIFFLSTSAHYPGMKSRNLSILWYLGDHFHYRWFSSRLLVVFTIDH